jgi:hypothetical protein
VIAAQRPPERQRITGSQPSYTRRRPVEVEREIDEQTALGEVYMRSLMRAQLRLAIGVIATLALTLGALPLLFAVAPAAGRADIAGIPVPWLLLGFLVYPALIGVAVYYVRQAERNEREFAELVDRQ